MTAGLWTDLSPSKRCQWVDLLRGLAVLVMIEVHVVNTWLRLDLRPEWLNYVNGLVARHVIKPWTTVVGKDAKTPIRPD